jgi:hypothetical protein
MAVNSVAYTYDFFTVRDERTGKELYKVPYSVYEQMHDMVVNKESGPLIKRVREYKTEWP